MGYINKKYFKVYFKKKIVKKKNLKELGEMKFLLLNSNK
jgi:hypothetical protein